MKGLFCIFLAFACFAAVAKTNVIFTTRHMDGRPNTWTVDDLQAALELINRKYHRDVATDAGRRAWHGKRLRAVTDATNLTVTTTYEDGVSFVDEAPRRTPGQQVAAANAKRKVTVATNGVPALLAAARQRRAAEINNGPTSIVVTLEVGGKK